MNVLLVGSGGREHALAWRLSTSPMLGQLHAAPGNPGVAELGDCHPVRAEDVEGLVELARALDADLVVVGPEAPLVTGLADELRHAGIPVFGPSAAAARIEGSKSFAKEVMAAAGVPTAQTLPVARPPCVLKADGLAAGKGVFVCRSHDELDAGLRALRQFGGTIVIEEMLEGEEISIFAVCDGSTALPLPSVQDYKRALDGDRGPNTGGMGAFSPVPGFGAAEVEELVDAIHVPVLEELARRRTPFVGALFAGLMLTAEGPRVLEFNARFGDPEMEALAPRLADDLLEVLAAAAAGDLSGATLDAAPEAAVTVVVASGDYPERGDAGTPIYGLAEAAEAGALVFHAGTALREGGLVTNGGRILDVTGVGPTVPAARAAAYDALGKISSAGMRYRSDIAAVAAGVGA
ncbi:MAG TPA: phosphoribosylamine--glycine ligase [Gaiellaceae bacterium]